MIRNRLIEIIKLANDLHWLEKNPNGYPLMQLSEVEKCMIAMVDQEQFNQMRVWCGKNPTTYLTHSKPLERKV